MKLLKRTFLEIQEKKPEWSSWQCFLEAIKNKDISRQVLLKHFSNLVNKDDYSKEDKMSLISHLLLVNKPAYIDSI